MGNRRLVLDIGEIVRLYTEEHKSALQISKQMNCSVMAIFRRLEAAGVKTKSQSEIMKGRKISEEHRLKIKEAVNNRDQTGENNPNWKGGRSWVGRSKDPKTHYVLVRINGRYVKEHRYVMEQHLGRKLLRTEEVHHKDTNKFNNDISNLEVLSKSEHARLHNSDPELRKYKSEMIRKARAERNWSTKKKDK